ncbi:MAG TPA: cupin domain-containing protein [Pyrinomonadaceae bacterium]|jgi:quercetin dioxygenase-like cupin family protein|nr:cupin domain-containing protein [Pyrinomonadaceae bacterium]
MYEAGLPEPAPAQSSTTARPVEDKVLPRFELTGDQYSVVLSGNDAAGEYSLYDIHALPCGGPGPHSHDFDEVFTVLRGEVQVTVRGRKAILKAGSTVNIPANAPHYFRDSKKQPVRMFCARPLDGTEEPATKVRRPVKRRTTTTPKLDETAQAALVARA